MMKKSITWLLITLINLIFNNAQAFDEEALMDAYGGEEFLYIATGRKQTVSQAPAVASIVTAKTLKKWGLVISMKY